MRMKMESSRGIKGWASSVTPTTPHTHTHTHTHTHHTLHAHTHTHKRARLPSQSRAVKVLYLMSHIFHSLSPTLPNVWRSRRSRPHTPPHCTSTHTHTHTHTHPHTHTNTRPVQQIEKKKW